MFKIGGKIVVSLMVFVAIGPLMSWLFLNSRKTKVAIVVDACSIVFLQVLFFMALLYFIVIARPLALVFEVDRLRVITYSDIPENNLPFTPEWFSPWNFKSKELPVVGVKELKSIDEKMASVEKAFQGVDAGQDPSRWIEFSEKVKQNMLSKSLPISILLEEYPEAYPFLEKIMGGDSYNVSSAKWVPIVSRHTYEWVAVLHPGSSRVLGVIPFDGFIY